MRLDLLWLLLLLHVRTGRSSENSWTSEGVGHVGHGKQLVEMILQILGGIHLGLGLASTTRDRVETLIWTASAYTGRAGLVAIASRLARSTKGTGALDGCSDGSLLIPVIRLLLLVRTGPELAC